MRAWSKTMKAYEELFSTALSYDAGEPRQCRYARESAVVR